MSGTQSEGFSFINEPPSKEPLAHQSVESCQIGIVIPEAEPREIVLVESTLRTLPPSLVRKDPFIIGALSLAVVLGLGCMLFSTRSLKKFFQFFNDLVENRSSDSDKIENILCICKQFHYDWSLTIGDVFVAAKDSGRIKRGPIGRLVSFGASKLEFDIMYEFGGSKKQ